MTSTDSSLIEHRFDTPQALATALAEAIAQRLSEAIAARERATLIVSGGTTPRSTLALLAQQPLAWPAVSVGLADERWVPASDPASNEAMVRASLLTSAAAHARFIGLYTGDPSPEDAEKDVAARIASLTRPFDAVLLGLGDDGHTASLFPGAAGLADALDPDGKSLCRAIRAAGLQPRMSLTLRALLDTRSLYLLFQGESKRRAFKAALDEGPIEAMPVRAVLRQRRVPVQVYWSQTG